MLCKSGFDSLFCGVWTVISADFFLEWIVVFYQNFTVVSMFLLHLHLQPE